MCKRVMMLQVRRGHSSMYQGNAKSRVECAMTLNISFDRAVIMPINNGIHVWPAGAGEGTAAGANPGAKLAAQQLRSLSRITKSRVSWNFPGVLNSRSLAGTGDSPDAKRRNNLNGTYKTTRACPWCLPAQSSIQPTKLSDYSVITDVLPSC